MIGPAPLPVTAVILTYNEERNLPRCLAAIAGRVSEIVVVDSFSTDSTMEIARKSAQTVVQHKYEGHPQQWHWTLTSVPMANEWVFAIDADFVVTEPLWDELRRRLSADEGIDGYYVRHREIFRGRRLSWGGVYPSYWLRIFRRGRTKVDLDEKVDLHFYVDGRTARIEFDVEEQNANDDSIVFWIEKQNRFARRQAMEELQRLAVGAATVVRPDFFGTPDQRKLFLKSIWYRLPLYLRPLAYFFYRYVLRLGFLDGRQGFVYHFTQALLYRMLVDINIEELRDGGRRG